MSELITELAAAPGRLCLVVGDGGDEVAERMAGVIDVTPCQVGKVVTDAPHIPSVSEIVAMLSGEPVLMALDALFWPAFAVDPVAVLRRLTRSGPTIAVWPGNVEGRMARYSEPGRADAYHGSLDDTILLRVQDVRYPDEIPYTVERVVP